LRKRQTKYRIYVADGTLHSYTYNGRPIESRIWEDVWQLIISVSKCSVVNIGKSIVPLSSLHIRKNVLNVTKIGIDLGITVTDDLKPRAHINSAVTKAHQRANAILRCFFI